MAAPPVTDNWPEIRRLAELGVPLPRLAEEYNISVKTVYNRCGSEDWMIPSKLQARLRRISETRKAVSCDPLFGGKGEAEKTDSLLLETWEERAANLRDLSYRVAVKAIKQSEGQIVVETASDLKHAVHVARQATGLLDTDQPQVQLSLFAGGMEMGPPVMDIQADNVGALPENMDDDGFWE